MRLPSLVAGAALLAAGCTPPETGVPLDRPVFPTGLAVHPRGDRLAVVSSAFDWAYDDGALLLADLELVRAELAANDAEDRRDAIVEGAYVKAARIPRLGDRPVFSSGGERLLLATRFSNLLTSIDVDPDAGFSCGATDDDGTPRCGNSPQALQVPENDPFDVRIVSETRDDAGTLTRVDGIVTLLSSSTVYFFRDDRSRPGAAQMQITGNVDLGDLVRGVRAAALRSSGGVTWVVAAVETLATTGSAGTRLVMFRPSGDTLLSHYDVTAAVGSLSIHDVVVVPGAAGESDAVLALAWAPDALLRFEIDEAPEGPLLRLAGVTESCAQPMSLALADKGGVQRALITCQGSGTVEAVDPRTLSVTGAVRFAGRAPYDVAVNPAFDEAYVSFFLDDSVGVLSLVDGSGAPRLDFMGRIGTPTEKPEDGRE